MLVVGKFICLFLAIWLTIVNVGRFINRQYISTVNIALQAIGYAGFIVLQWLI